MDSAELSQEGDCMSSSKLRGWLDLRVVCLRSAVCVCVRAYVCVCLSVCCLPHSPQVLMSLHTTRAH